MSNYSGQELPNNYTMDHLSLGELDTVTPVLGHLNSVYGYRDSPINGEYQFHPLLRNRNSVVSTPDGCGGTNTVGWGSSPCDAAPKTSVQKSPSSDKIVPLPGNLFGPISHDFSGKRGFSAKNESDTE